MTVLVFPYLPFSKIGAGRRNGRVRNFEGAEYAPLFERRSQTNLMGRSVRGFSKNENVPSEIKDGVDAAGIGERSGNDVGEIALADGSEIELHPY